jgi:hypothetical protein
MCPVAEEIYDLWQRIELVLLADLGRLHLWLRLSWSGPLVGPFGLASRATGRAFARYLAGRVGCLSEAEQRGS